MVVAYLAAFKREAVSSKIGRSSFRTHAKKVGSKEENMLDQKALARRQRSGLGGGREGGGGQDTLVYT